MSLSARFADHRLDRARRRALARLDRTPAASAGTPNAGAGTAGTAAAHTAMAGYLAGPLPGSRTPLERLPLLAMDIETTGLDPRVDRLLSVGFVPADGLRLDLSRARHLLVAEGGAVGQSATVHGLTDDAVASGTGLPDVLREVLTALTGRVLLAHFAQIETGFLRQAGRACFGVEPPLRAVDTLELARRLTTTPDGAAPPGALRLWNARGRYGLPTYRAHEALTDALACAELYLAQVVELGDPATLTLADLER